MFALTRRFHEEGTADDLRLPRAELASAALAPVIAGVRSRQRALRARPERWEAMVSSNLGQARGLAAEPAAPSAYERQGNPISTISH